MDTTGAVIGVALAAIVIDLAQGGAVLLAEDTFRLLALVALVPGVLAVLAVVLFVRDVPPATPAPAAPVPAPATTVPPPAAAGAPSLRGFPVAFWLWVAAAGLFTLGNSSDAFLALRSQDLGVGVRDLALVLVAFNVVDALVSWPIGALSDRVGRRRLLGLAWALYAVAYLGFALADGPGVVLPLWLLYGLYYGVTEGVGRALVADLAAPERRATAYGIVSGVTGLAILPASLVAGLLWDGIGPDAPFWFGAACALVALGLLALVRPARERAPG
jgi:predicted MFS family arabinose efflux permease